MIGFTDRHNFHSQGFPALFRAIELDGVRVITYAPDDLPLKQAFGDYSPFRGRLESSLAEVRALGLARLEDHEVLGVSLFDVCRYEVLRHVMLEPGFYDEPRDNDRAVVYDAIARHHPALLLENLAAALHWVRFWREQLHRHRSQRPTIAMFGNSLSYTRSLALQAPALGVTPLVFEHFFTGHDHYMEPRVEPLQGYGDLRLPAAGDVDVALVSRRLSEAKNRNVTQAPFRREPRSRDGRRTVLVLGQVVNDFAAITPGNRTLGTVARYRELIDALMADTDARVVFKAHPYEWKQTLGRGRVTYDELRAHAARRGLDNTRLSLVEDEPLAALFAEADLVVTLHSQGALEALAEGIPVATLGRPFYGEHGFTHDYDDAGELARDVAEGALDGLSDAETEAYLRFMTAAFRRLINRHEPRQQMLDRLARVGVHAEGASRAARRRPTDPRYDRVLRKARKLWNNPRRFVRDAIDKRRGGR